MLANAPDRSGELLPRAQDHRGVGVAMLTGLTIHELGDALPPGRPDADRGRRATISRGSTRSTARSSAFLTVTARAGAAPRRPRPTRASRAGTPRGPLDGVPIALKDILCTRGVPHHLRLEDPRALRAALRRDRGRRGSARRRRGAPRQAEHGRVRDGLVERELRPSARRATRGTSTRVPGGSSGGSAAAVAAGLAAARSAPTPAARSASRRRSAASSG